MKPVIRKYFTPLFSINSSSLLKLFFDWIPQNADKTLLIIWNIFIDLIKSVSVLRNGGDGET